MRKTRDRERRGGSRGEESRDYDATLLERERKVYWLATVNPFQNDIQNNDTTRYNDSLNGANFGSR